MVARAHFDGGQGSSEAAALSSVGTRENDKTLRRLMRKPAIVELLAREVALLGAGHAILDPQGRVVVGDAGDAAAGGRSHEVVVGARTVARVIGSGAQSLSALLRALAAQDDETQALVRESLDRYKEVTMLYSVSEKIIGATDQSQIATVVCQETERFLRCDATAVLLINPETNRLETSAARGLPFHDRATREIGTDIVASVLNSGIAEIVNDVAADARGLATRNQLRSIACCPLRSHERVFGVLIAGSGSLREFSAGELQAVNSIAAHAAAAIEAARLDRDLKARSHKPVNLIYGVDERPGAGITAMLAIQHVLIAAMSLAYPVLVTLEAGGSREHAASVVSMSLIAMAIATLLQAAKWRAIGSGFLAPYITSAIYLGPSLLAARVGGLKMVFGMTIFSGLVVLGLSQLMRRFRKLFPPEVSGVVVLMVGVSIVPVALPRFLGLGGADVTIEVAEWVTGLLTLGTIVALSVMPLGQVRLYATAIGIAGGYGAAALMGLLDQGSAAQLAELPLVGLHTIAFDGLSLDASLIVPFVAAALASSIKEAGLVISCQKTNDALWKRPDPRSTSGGLVATALGNAASGAIGGMGVSISAGNVGLAAATGATSRVIGVAVAAIFVALAFMPKITAMLAMIPSPVMGAGLLYVACHLIASGAELITSRMLDARRNYVIGLPVLAGIGMLAAPTVFAQAPGWSQSLLTSPLSLATILALFLNLLLNAGVSSRAKLAITIDEATNENISRFLERMGATWGARLDVIRRAGPAITEWCEEFRQITGATEAAIELTFDEFRLVATIRGGPPVGAAPSAADAVASLAHAARTIGRRYECVARLMGGRDVSFDFEH